MAYTNIDDPSAHFQVKLWTGTGVAGNTITLDGNSDMQPDWMWHKEPTDTNGWHQMDSSRGPTYVLASQGTGAEYDVLNTYISSFNSNGFTAGYGDSSINSAGVSQCSWMWHCNGGTTSSNTDGNTTTTVQANQDAGFSIVTYTGTGSASQTMGHGLGVTPNIVLTKARSGTSNWSFNGNFGGLTYGTNKLTLNTSAALAADNNEVTAASSTTFTGGGSNAVNGNGSTYVAYCFASKQGYSKFGSYIANANTNGTFVYLGFKPAFIIFKNTQQTTNWAMYDVKRDSFNVATNELQPNTTAAANDDIPYSQIDILSNGIKMRNNNGLHTNAFNGQKIIYMAFAENPFVTSTGIPTTAR
jgi:hypothetical protein